MNTDNYKILVTGSAGFIGAHLVTRLIDLGHDVIGLDNINDYYDQNLKYARVQNHGIIKDRNYNRLVSSQKHKNYKFIKLNLEDKANLTKLFKDEKFDIVCNLAGQAGVRHSIENPDTYIDSNIVGFMNILEACREFNVKNFLYASSSSVYGLTKELPFSTKDCTDTPISIYAATKKQMNLWLTHILISTKSRVQVLDFSQFTVHGQDRIWLCIYL